jgi:hypothetical protein
MPFGITTIIFPDDHAVIRKLDSSPVYPTPTPNIGVDRHPRTRDR